jgi:hypothetical protein
MTVIIHLRHIDTPSSSASISSPTKVLLFIASITPPCYSSSTTLLQYHSNPRTKPNHELPFTIDAFPSSTDTLLFASHHYHFITYTPRVCLPHCNTHITTASLISSIHSIYTASNVTFLPLLSLILR